MSEPIRIVRLIEEEVTTPSMDGTAGSALYCVPFELSGNPPVGWATAFVEAWRNPQTWTSMHRRSIASVSGKKILLDGTTIEEVTQYHKATLLAAVEQANIRVEQDQRALAQRQSEKKEREAEHRKQVAEAAAKVKFD